MVDAAAQSRGKGNGYAEVEDGDGMGSRGFRNVCCLGCQCVQCSTALCPLGAEREIERVEPEVCQDPQLESTQ